MTLPHFAQSIAFYTIFLFVTNIVALKYLPGPAQYRMPHPLMMLLNPRQITLRFSPLKILFMIVKLFLFLTLVLAAMIAAVVFLQIEIVKLLNIWIIGIALGVTWLHDQTSPEPWNRNKRFIAYPLALAISASWLIVPNWFTYNLAAMVPIYVMISMTKPLDFKYLVILLTAVVLYDIVNVWGTEWMFALVDQLNVPHNPLLVQAPIDLLNANSPNLAVLGSGDLAFSSLGFASAHTHGLSQYVIGGFVFGIALAFAMVLLTGRGVPAMLPLSPFILISITYGASKKGIRLC